MCGEGHGQGRHTRRRSRPTKTTTARPSLRVGSNMGLVCARPIARPSGAKCRESNVQCLLGAAGCTSTLSGCGTVVTSSRLFAAYSPLGRWGGPAIPYRPSPAARRRRLGVVHALVDAQHLHAHCKRGQQQVQHPLPARPLHLINQSPSITKQNKIIKSAASHGVRAPHTSLVKSLATCVSHRASGPSQPKTRCRYLPREPGTLLLLSHHSFGFAPSTPALSDDRARIHCET